jgi:hypothetical protein
MTPALLIELDVRAGGRARRMVEIARIALRAGHSGISAGAGTLAIPRRVGMAFTYPAASGDVALSVEEPPLAIGYFSPAGLPPSVAWSFSKIAYRAAGV